MKYKILFMSFLFVVLMSCLVVSTEWVFDNVNHSDYNVTDIDYLRTNYLCNDTICFNMSDLEGDITSVNTPDNYLYGGGNAGDINLYMNVTTLNESIDDRSLNYTYSNSTGLNLENGVFSLNTLYTDARYYVRSIIDGMIQGIGNWTADKPDYYTSAQVDTEILDNNNTLNGTYATDVEVADRFISNNNTLLNYTDETNESMGAYVDSRFINNNLTLIAYIDSENSVYNTSMVLYVGATNVSMKDYVDNRFNDNNLTLIALDESTNTSMKLYVDAQDGVYNSSMVVYVDSANDSMKLYVDGRFTTNNASLITYILDKILDNNNTVISYVNSRFTDNNVTLIALDTSTNISMKGYVDTEIAKVNGTLNATYVTHDEQLSNNITVVAYIDSQDILYNESMVTYVIAQILDNNLSVLSYVDSQDEIYNTSMKTYTDNTFIPLSSEGDLNVNHSDSTTSWAGVTGFVTRWFADIANVFTFNETLLNQTIDDKIDTHNQTLNDTYVTQLEMEVNNDTVVYYIDTENVIYNDSMVTYVTLKILDNNNSVVTYINSQDDIYNQSMVTYVNAANVSLKYYVDDRFTHNNLTLINLDTTTNTSMKNYVDARFISNNATLLSYVLNEIDKNNNTLTQYTLDAISNNNDSLKQYSLDVVSNNNESLTDYTDNQISSNNDTLIAYTNAQILDNNDTVIVYVDTQGSAVNASARAYTLSEILSNNDSVVAYIDVQDGIFNDSMVTYSDASNTSMKLYVDGRFTSNNLTLIAYVLAEILSNNNTVVSYIDTRFTNNNATLLSYIDAQDVVYNTSMKTYVDTANVSMKSYTDDTFITLANEGNLNVNHSDSTTLAEDSTAWITMTSLQAKWLADVGNVLTFDEVELNSSITTALTTTYFNASVIAVVTGTGQGAISDLQTYNSVSYNVSEVDSDFDFRVNFTGVTGINQLVYRFKTEIDESHTMKVQIWDYSINDWEGYAEEGAREDYGIFTYGVYDEDDHISDGVVQVRFYTTNSPPNTVHKWQFDWITISDGVATPSSAESDPFSVRKDGTTPLTGDWDAGAFDIIADSFNGSWNGSSLYDLSSEVDTKISNNNVTVVNYIDTRFTNNNGTLTAYTLNEILKNNATVEAYILAEILSNNATVEAYILSEIANNNGTLTQYTLDAISNNNASLTDYTDDRMTNNNDSLKQYSLDVVSNNNDSLKDYTTDEILSNNATIIALDTSTNVSMKAYVDSVSGSDVNKTYVDDTFIAKASEGDLNVNESDHWDDLDTPADINAADITDDGTYSTPADVLSDIADNNATVEAYILAEIASNNGTLTAYTLAEIADNNATVEAYILAEILSNNATVEAYILAEILSNNNTLDATYATDAQVLTQIDNNNDTVVPYINAQNTEFNKTLADIVPGDGLTGGADNVLPGPDKDITVTMGTPGASTGTSTDAVTADSHTHSVTTGAVTDDGTNLVDANDVYDFTASNNATIIALDITTNTSMKAYVDSVSGSDVNKTYTDTQDAAVNASARAYTLSEILSNNATVLADTLAQIATNNGTVEAYILAEIASNNDTVLADTLAQIATNNATVEAYILAEILSNNGSVIAYINSQDGVYNASMKAYADATFFTQAIINGIIAGIGNWTADKGDYDTTTIIDGKIAGIGNWTADKGDYYTSAETLTEIDNNNDSVVSYTDDQDAAVNASARAYTLSEILSNNGTLITYIDTKTSDVNKSYVDTRFTNNNGTLTAYTIAEILSNNATVEAYILAEILSNNGTLTAYTDTRFTNNNATLTAYTLAAIATNNATLDATYYKSGDAATFATVDTGQGANELYDMDQNVTTSSDVVYNSIGIGGSVDPDYDINILNTVNPRIAFNNNTNTISIGYAAQGFDYFSVRNEGAGKDMLIVNSNASTSSINIDANSFVGIGRSAPASKLDVYGNVNATGFLISGVSVTTTMDTKDNAVTAKADAQYYNSTEAATFTTVDTGNGATEVYDMNQDVQNDDDVTFNKITTTTNLIVTGRIISG